MNTEATLTAPGVATPDHKKVGPAKRYKSVPESWKTLPEPKFRQVLSNLESILVDISADGVRMNSPDGKIPASTLHRWAEHLRDALKTLTGGR